ncbi:MAG TPA: HNH endonuclease signature motif containing protein [Candidatus Krumholzibacteria bacterium]|nr:HNH endonuclease signature motif containing protein [Candidatus Krumholzibacteria bacterium]
MSLRSLSDQQILAGIQHLTRQDRSLTLQVLLHLNEIERRRLHLKQGYSSLFDYCTSGLGYSVPAAVRRIQTARCIRRFPEVYALLESNEVNLSTISLVSRLLSESNKDTLLDRIRGRSHREVKAIVAEYQPYSNARDVIRPVVVRIAASPTGVLNPLALEPLGIPTPGAGGSAVRTTDTPPQSAPGSGSPATGGAPEGTTADSNQSDVPAGPADLCENSDYIRIGCAPGMPPEGPVAQSSGSTGGNSCEKRVQFQFTASEAFENKYHMIRSLAWHQLPGDPSIEQVFELVLDFFLEAKDPERRHTRRTERIRTRENACHNGRGKHPSARLRRETPVARQRSAAREPTAGSRSVPDARRIPIAVRDEVYARDHGRCAFVGANGRRCPSRHALQIDHVRPVARGGAGTAANLRLLCAYHNRLEAERLLGPSARIRAGSAFRSDGSGP